ncbi:MAG: oligopeptide transporter, OPT family [Planctomycetota bacterium]
MPSPTPPPRKLPKSAYELAEGETYHPLTEGESLREFTLKAVCSGITLGIIFGAANTYLGLKAGLTISTSIPVAVLTVVVFRTIALMGGQHSILETNMSQTIGSASSSIASGAIFTLPALFMWGMDINWLQLTLLAMAGGLLGVLAMIPLRPYLIKKEHGKLPYPEGMACAEVLVASESGGEQAKGVFGGIAVGMLFKALTSGFKCVPESLHFALPWPARAQVAVGVSPALVGVGYILGLRVASVMVGGAALSSLVLIPAIYYWGRGFEQPIYPEKAALIAEMSVGDIWNRYIRYIGAGAVATGGILTLIKSLPTMWESFRLSVRQFSHGPSESTARTDRDLGMPTVMLFVSGILMMLALTPGVLGYIDSLFVRSIAAVLIGIFAFFFVTVSSRIVGMVGQTSNPVSGMTIACLLGTSFVFYLMGWTDDFGKASALMVGTAVCIAASIAGDTSQDLKTGFILGATPRWQQIGELIGVITSAGAVCWVLILLNNTFRLGSEELPAPQGTLMRLVIEGVLDQNLPWPLLGIGVVIAAVAAACRIPVLAFAVGVYLPLETMAAIFLGGLIRWLLVRGQPEAIAEPRRERGILFGSGLVGGGGLMGVILALVVTANQGERIVGFSQWLGGLAEWGQQLLALGALVTLIALIVAWAGRAPRAA